MQQTVKCKKCGKRERLTRWSKDFSVKLEDMKLCFDCYFWVDALNNLNTYVIDGEAYTVSPELPAGGMRGFGGRKFRFRELDTGKVITTTNLWYRGEVPERFKWPNDAEWV